MVASGCKEKSNAELIVLVIIVLMLIILTTAACYNQLAGTYVPVNVISRPTGQGESNEEKAIENAFQVDDEGEYGEPLATTPSGFPDAGHREATMARALKTGTLSSTSSATEPTHARQKGLGTLPWVQQNTHAHPPPNFPFNNPEW